MGKELSYIELSNNSHITIQQVLEVKSSVVVIKTNKNENLEFLEKYKQQIMSSDKLGAIFITDLGVVAKTHILTKYVLEQLDSSGVFEIQQFIDYLKTVRTHNWLELESSFMRNESADRERKEDLSFFYNSNYFKENSNSEIVLDSELKQLNIENFKFENEQLNKYITEQNFRGVTEIVGKWLSCERQRADFLLLKAYAELNLGNYNNAIRSAFAACEYDPQSETNKNFLSELLRVRDNQKIYNSSLTFK